MNPQQHSEASQTPASAAGNPRRKKALGAVAGVVLITGAAYGAYWALVLNHYEITDNAYVQDNVVLITPQAAGTVLWIGAEETDCIKAGQSLVRLDPADARVALEQAEAQLAQAVREVRTLFANSEALKAEVAQREADAARAEADLVKAQDDKERRVPLLSTGAVAKEEVDHADAELSSAKKAVTAAQAAVAAAKEQLASNQSLIDGTTVEGHPNVQLAAARVREAYLSLRRVNLPAPVDGCVAKRSVQLGQRVQPGQTLMAVAPLDRVWVDANFKEGQLRRLRIGQPATLFADVYGKQVEYHGTVAGLGAGTGAAFALLPAQNATGNWIKIVQRVPVRIALDSQELSAHPLRVGLSMTVRVDVSNRDGKMFPDQRTDSVAQTVVFDRLDSGADDVVRQIIAVNTGGRAARKELSGNEGASQLPSTAPASTLSVSIP